MWSRSWRGMWAETAEEPTLIVHRVEEVAGRVVANEDMFFVLVVAGIIVAVLVVAVAVLMALACLAVRFLAFVLALVRVGFVRIVSPNELRDRLGRMGDGMRRR